jgi:hypothetical protein
MKRRTNPSKVIHSKYSVKASQMSVLAVQMSHELRKKIHAASNRMHLTESAYARLALESCAEKETLMP